MGNQYRSITVLRGESSRQSSAKRLARSVSPMRAGARAARTVTSRVAAVASADDDSMLAANQRIWGYETNFGGLGELSVVKANQLMPKPAHLTWEEAAVNALTNSTSYRMLVSPNGADDAGSDGPDLGRERRDRRLRVPVRAQRRRHARRRGLEPRARRGAARAGRRARDRPQGRGLRVLVRRPHPGPGGVATVRQEDPRARGPRPRHRVRAPRALHDGRVGVRLRARRHDRHVRRRPAS